jgi:hypothetical protein
LTINILLVTVLLVKPTLSLAVLLWTWSSVSLIGQGALTPSGPPAPTMKSLSDLDAKLESRTPIPGGIFTTFFTISRPGSYYLTGNRTNTAAGSYGILVNANDVVIDLNGFTLSGADTAQFGVYATSRTNLTILNGTIRDFTSVGIITPLSGMGHTIYRVSVLNNGGVGIGMIAARGCRVVDCVVEENHGGITVSDASLIAHNRVISNGGVGSGIGAASNCLITENIITSFDTNAAHASGIQVNGKGSRIVGNTISYTSDDGILALGTHVIRANHVSYANLATNSSSGGITTFNDSSEVEDNVTFNCISAGIWVNSTGTSVINNRVKSSPVGIHFASPNCYFANNRVSGATNAFTGSVPGGALNGGGNISF